LDFDSSPNITPPVKETQRNKIEQDNASDMSDEIDLIDRS